MASDKEIYTEEEHLRHYRKTQDSLAKAQRRLSHCQKGSRRYQKQRRRVALLHERTANQRKDYLHKKSRQIINAFDAVCIENLDMKGIAGGLYFGKSVYDNGWGCSAAFWSIS